MTERHPGSAFGLTVVAAALVDGAGRVLVQRRPAGRDHAGLWEFPGGKLEAGETPEAALARELAEELSITVASDAMTPLAFSSEGVGDRHLLLLLYLVERWTGTPDPAAADALRWYPPEDLAELAMPTADRPLVAELAERLRQRRIAR